MKNKTILVVDEDPQVAVTIKEYLDDSTINFDLLSAENGQMACKIADSIQPNIIIANGHTSDMTGAQLVRRLKMNPLTRDIPVLIAQESDTPQGEEEDVAIPDCIMDYVKKPLEKNEIKARIRSILYLAEALNEIRKKKDAVLLKNKFATAMLQSLPVPLFHQSKNGYLMNCNKNFELFIRKEKKDIIGKTIHDIFPGQVANLFKTAFSNLSLNNREICFEANMEQEKGEERKIAISCSLFLPEPAELPGYIGCITDISHIVAYDKKSTPPTADTYKQEANHNSLRMDDLQAELNSLRREQATHVGLLINSEKEKDKLLQDMTALHPFLNKEGQTQLLRNTKLLKQELRGDNWFNLETKFEDINLSFFSSLERECPDITKNEKRLCAYFKMNLSSSEIAKLTDKSLNSINVAFARLRTKLGLSSNKDLKSRLLQLANPQILPVPNASGMAFNYNLALPKIPYVR